MTPEDDTVRNNEQSLSPQSPERVSDHLERWKELESRATPGPWWSRQHFRGQVGNYEYGLLAEVEHDALGFGTKGMVDDARFIAESRTAVPALIAEVEQLKTENEDLHAAIRLMKAVKEAMEK